MKDILAIANQKGGVGKTTTAVNLAASLAKLKQRVLLLDLDAQGNATMGSGVDKRGLDYTIADVIIDDVAIQDIIVTTAMGYDLVGANQALAGSDIALFTKPENTNVSKEFILAQALSSLPEYEYVIIDCAPSLNLLTINALCAAWGVIIPMQCEYYALEGLADLLETIDRLQRLNPRLTVRGVLRTLYDGRNTLTKDVSAELEAHFGEQMFATVIPRNVRLAEAPAHGMSALQYARHSRGSRAYLKLAKEIVKKNGA